MFNLDKTHPSWQPLLKKALEAMDATYLQQLQQKSDWLPGSKNIFNAFTLPLEDTYYILFGESPYPRTQSANGYAFWDAAVTDLWSTSGLSKQVNRATSLRNLMKMLLLIRGDLTTENTSQTAIASINKSELIQTGNELFINLLNSGFLLLNASLVLSNTPVNKESRFWQPFCASLLTQLTSQKPDIQLILLGNIAKKIDALNLDLPFKKVVAEHPYNISFIHNPMVQKFFKPFNLLAKHAKMRD